MIVASTAGGLECGLIVDCGSFEPEIFLAAQEILFFVT
jgi:hypothetical protein